MITDSDMPVPGDEPSVSIVDTTWGAVVRTRRVLGTAAAVMLRRAALRHHDGVVLLDVRATSVAEPAVVAAVVYLAAGVRAREGVLRVVQSPHTPQDLVAAAGAPVYASLADAFGFRSFPVRSAFGGPHDPAVWSSPPDDRRS